jgi:RecJ-like exonuclease
MCEICWKCDGTGERCSISGALCWECNGTGLIEDPDDDEFYEEEEYDREDFET